jgi:hypothetical protein
MRKTIFIIGLLYHSIPLLLQGQNFEIASGSFDKKITEKEFLSLFKDTSLIIAREGLSIVDTKKNKLLYCYGVFMGSVKIIKVDNNTFYLIGSTGFPYANTYAQFEVGKHILKINKGEISIEQDKHFSKCPQLDSFALADIINKYNRMKQDSSFASKDWDKITERNADSIAKLGYELMLGILNDCKTCIPLFENMRTDFVIINAGATSEDFSGCEGVLKLYGYIRRKPETIQVGSKLYLQE